MQEFLLLVLHLRDICWVIDVPGNLHFPAHCWVHYLSEQSKGCWAKRCRRTEGAMAPQEQTDGFSAKQRSFRCVSGAWVETPERGFGGEKLSQPVPLHHSKLAASRWDLLPVPGAVCSPFLLTSVLQCLSRLGWDSLGINQQGKTDLPCAPLPPHFQRSHGFKEGQNCTEHPPGHHCELIAVIPQGFGAALGCHRHIL